MEDTQLFNNNDKNNHSDLRTLAQISEFLRLKRHAVADLIQ
jgi:hypothetical protein